MQNKIKKLTAELLQYCNEYYVLDNPSISDYEYDKKFDQLKQLEQETGFCLSVSPTQKVQGECVPSLRKHIHSVPMLSANKSKDIKDVSEFIGNKDVCVSYKLDGITVVLIYKNGKLFKAATRGNGFEGEDITHTARLIKNIPKFIPYKKTVEIRGEAVISWENYNKLSNVGAPRNVVAGALRRLDAESIKNIPIDFYAFTLVNWRDCPLKHKRKDSSLEFLKNNGFDTVPYLTYARGVMKTTLLEKQVRSVLNRETYDYPTDGWVFEYQSLDYGESLGSTAHHDKKLFALKPEAEEVETKFIGVDYNVTRFGMISLTATFEPVEIDNTIVSRASLHNLDFFNKLQLGTGDIISVIKANEIIPHITRNNTKSGTYQLIRNCPCCGAELIVHDNNLYCPNENCKEKILHGFVNFVSKNGFNMTGISKKIIESLIDYGLVTDYCSLFSLKEKKKELLQIPKFGKKQVDNILKSIEDAKTISLVNFICALGIEGFSLNMAKLIAEDCITFENLCINFDHHFFWADIDGVGEMLANNLNTFWSQNSEWVKELATQVVFTQGPRVTKEDETFFTGKSVCVTGKLYNHTREEIEDILTKCGGRIVKAVTKNTDYLIYNEHFRDTTHSAKYNAAYKLNIPIVSEERFFIMLKRNTKRMK